MPRLARDPSGGARSKLAEEIVRDGLRELQLGRKLDEQRPKPVPQRMRLRQEQIHFIIAIDQLQLMGDLLWQLDREAEIKRHALSPALPGGQPMRPMEGTVDLRDAEPRCVALERAPGLRKPARNLPRNAPPGGADANAVHAQLKPYDAEQEKQEQRPSGADQQRGNASEAVREEEHANCTC